MTVQTGRHKIGADRDRLVIRTARDGMAASVGHDLVIEVARWSGELTVEEDGKPAALEVRIDTTSLSVLSGTGGVKPLTDKDKRDIVSNARKVLMTDRHPEATFRAEKFEPSAGGGGTISGTLTLAGQARPFTLQVTETGPDRNHATGTVVQSSFGIKPYSGLFGTLKVRDAVDVEVDVDLSQPEGAS